MSPTMAIQEIIRKQKITTLITLIAMINQISKNNCCLKNQVSGFFFNYNPDSPTSILWIFFFLNNPNGLLSMCTSDTILLA